MVEYQQELVKNVLITLDVVDESSQTLVHRVPANEIGPAVIKVKFPGLYCAGAFFGFGA